MEQDLTYFARRAKEERIAATASVDDRARDVHLELARRYDAAVQELETERAKPVVQEPRLTAAE